MALSHLNRAAARPEAGDHATKPNPIGAFDQRQAVEHDRHDQQNPVSVPAEGQTASGGKLPVPTWPKRLAGQRQGPGMSLRPTSEGRLATSPRAGARPNPTALSPRRSAKVGVTTISNHGHWSEWAEAALLADGAEQGCRNDARQQFIGCAGRSQHVGVHEGPLNHCRHGERWPSGLAPPWPGRIGVAKHVHRRVIAISHGTSAASPRRSRGWPQGEWASRRSPRMHGREAAEQQGAHSSTSASKLRQPEVQARSIPSCRGR